MQIFAASIISALILRVVGLNPRSEAGREARICSTFANAGPLPLLFVDALFKTHPDPTLRPRAVAFISFYLLAWSPLFWNYGYGILVGEERDAAANALLLKKDDPGAAVEAVSGSGKEEEGGMPSMHGNHTTTASSLLLPPALPMVKQFAHDPAGFVMGKVQHVVASGALRKLLNPPTLGCTLGALVGIIPPFRRYADAKEGRKD